MTQDKDHFESYQVLSEIKLSAHERAEIWQSIELGMERSRTNKKKRGMTMIKNVAAAVAVLAIFGGGIGYEVHHRDLGSNPGVTASSHTHVPPSTSNSLSPSTDQREVALIKSKGYSVNGTTPNATVKTSSGATLSAWIGVSGRDGHNQFVFFFLNGTYLGTDTAQPSVEITSAKAAGSGIAVTYPVYMQNDSFAHPTGTPVTITYTWNGSKLVPDKPYPKQFQPNNTATRGHNAIATTSYATSAEAANQIANLQGGDISGAPVDLGHGITGLESAGMGHARYEWREGNWTIEIRYYTRNTGVKQVAEDMVSYLHTHMLPAPNNHGVIVVNSTDANTTSFDPKTIIAWQEGTKVNQMQQTGNPIQALEVVVNNK